MKGNFNALISADQPVLIDFYAEWCGPCKMMAPILQEVARSVNSEARIIKIDVDKNPELAARYQVQGVPTLMLFKKGQLLWRQSGVTDKNTLLKIIQSHQGN